MLRKEKNIPKSSLDQQQYNNRTIPFKRGDIVDRNGTKLATSERVYNVVVDAKVITSNKKYMNPTVKVLAECFSLKKKAIRTQVKKNPNSRYIVLKKESAMQRRRNLRRLQQIRSIILMCRAYGRGRLYKAISV